MSFIRSALVAVSLFAVGLASSSCAESTPAPALGVPAPQPPACIFDAATAAQHWTDFRATYPYHAQTIALSEPFGEGCRTIIFAEPPPGTTPSTLAPALPSSTRLTAHRQKIGFDGWVTDWVGVLAPMTADDVRRLVSAEAQVTFGTDYKAYVTPIEGVPRGVSDLSLRPSPGSLSHWLEANTALVPVVRDQPPTTVSAALGGGADGVFVTATPGLVLWSLPRPASLDGRAAAARQFALDADLVLGAVASERGLLIVGRERVTPVDSVAPLRYETLVTLAATTEKELAQSYERRNVLAGRFDGSHDWAPIYLSAELVDTEFGSLLNLADQVLKSTSNSGETSYVNFSHLQPLTWPFPQALPTYLNASLLTYNWNTNGVGAIADDGVRSVYWVRDTGALPVTYLPEGTNSSDATHAAQTAQQFFAAQDDPLLVRVVQYSAIYQIFHAFGVKATPLAAPIDVAAAGKALEDAAYGALSKLMQADRDGLREAVTRQLAREGRPLRDEKGELSTAALNVLAEVLSLCVKLADVGEDERDGLLHVLAHSLANPDRDLAKIVEKIEAQVELTDDEAAKVAGTLVAKDFSAYGTAVRAFVDDLDGTRARFSAAVQGSRDPTIRTPSIVVSGNQGSLKSASGGHNIDAAVPRVSLRADAPGVVRAASGETRVLSAVRSFDDVVLDPDGELRTASGTTPPQALRDLAPGAGTGGSRGLALEAMIDRRAAQTDVAGAPLTIARTSSGELSVGDGNAQSAARNHVEAVNLLARRIAEKDGTVVVHVDGLSDDEIRVTLRSAELKAGREVLGLRRGPASGASHSLAEGRLGKTFRSISEPEIVRLADGRAQASFRVDATVPGKPTLSARIKVLFSKSVVGRFGGRLHEVVKIAWSRIAQRFATRPPTVAEAMLELRRDLRRFDKQVGVMLDAPDADDMATDFVVAEERVPALHAGGGARAD